MNRRTFLKTMPLAMGASVVAGFSQAIAARRKPNIIFFMVDDYDKPETSVYGGRALTPNLDRLAAEGITFHNAHMTSTAMNSSRTRTLSPHSSNWQGRGFLKSIR